MQNFVDVVVQCSLSYICMADILDVLSNLLLIIEYSLNYLCLQLFCSKKYFPQIFTWKVKKNKLLHLLFWNLSVCKDNWIDDVLFQETLKLDWDL